MRKATEDEQKTLCEKYQAGYHEADLDKIVGVADDVLKGQLPLNGLRHSVTETTTGWYIWSGGEPSSHPDFFKPMHLSHLLSARPEIAKYLGLAPGWRFLINPEEDYEDVWQDLDLILTSD